MKFRLKKFHNDESGIVLITVVIISMVMLVFCVATISITASQTTSNQHQTDRIKAEQLAKGAYWFNYMNLVTNGTSATPYNVVLDGKTFSPTITENIGTGPDGTNQYDVRVNY